MIDQKFHRAEDGSDARADGATDLGNGFGGWTGFPFDPTTLVTPFYPDADASWAARHHKITSFLAAKAGEAARPATSAAVTAASSNSAGAAPLASNAIVSITPVVTINTSQIALGADVATALYGVTGSGLKIGVISDSFNAKGGAAADMANGILPNVTILSDATTGSDEGRAMLELAYSIAPGASYYTAEGTSLADEVTALKNAGVNIIIDDLSVGGEGLYQVGSDTDVAIENAVASGIDYFTSAGNNGSSSYYEQGFAPLVNTMIPGIGTVTANNFGTAANTSPYLSLTIATGSTINPIFQFAQPFSSFPGNTSNGPTNSLAIYLLDANGAIVASSTVNDTLPGSDPTQGFSFENTTASTAFRLVVVQNGGVVPTGQLFKLVLEDGGATINNPNAGTGSGDLLGHELLNNINVLGSVAYTATPAYGTSPAVIDSGSSVGPGLILFDAQGNPITPVTQGVPQFESPDGTLTGSANSNFATSPFFGTSAAAPSAGAVGALVLQANRALTTTQVTSVLAQSVIPVTALAPSSGAGLIQARAAVEIAAADAGARWTTSAGGNWNSAASWSGTATPTNAQAASLDDNLGGFTGQYTVTVNTGGDTAGSLAIAAPSGSSATLVIAVGGSLAIGGAKTANITAGDLLVAGNSTLKVQGGNLTVAGSLNVNNGAVNLASGAITAANYAQNAGSITIGGGGGASLTLSDATGFDEIGGSATVLASATITTNLLTLSAAMLTIAGKVTDAGALVFGTNGTAGAITLQTGGELDIGGTTDFESISYAGPAVLAFTSSNTTVTGLGLNDVISNFTDPGDVVDLTGYLYDAADSLGFMAGSNGGPGDLTVFDTNGNGIAQLNYAASGNYTLASFALSHDASGHVEVIAACYARGTRIATPTGDASIETLSIGDLVLTASGDARPVRWLGHRAVDVAAQPDPSMFWPIVVQADAFAPGVPARDLLLSPEHKIADQGVLIPVYLLQNDCTIFQRRCDAIEYWHLELDTHDVVLAEGMPAETYLDTGNRSAFVNGDAFMTLHPDFRTHGDADTCLPLVLDGPSLTAVKAALLDRAKTFGHALTEADDMHIVADGARIEPVHLADRIAAFLLPAGCADISLRSRVFVPARTSADRADGRSLGVYLERIQLDGQDVALADDNVCGVGWHAHEEHEGRRGRRWTNGATPLPANTRLVVLDFAGRGQYWTQSQDNVVALFG